MVRLRSVLNEWDAYERISSDPTEAEEGVRRQRLDTEQAVQAKGGVVRQHHTDNDTSAYKKQRVTITDHYGNTYDVWRVIRPVWAAALQRLRSGEASRLMVYDLDRLARDPRDLEDAIEVVEHYGAEIRSVTASDVDLSTNGGIQMARLMVTMANKQSADTARRVKRQKVQRAIDGLAQGGRYRVFGYDRQWNPISDEATIVLEVFTRRASGESITAIAKDLNVRNITTVNGKRWDSGNLSKLFAKSLYAGLRTYEGQVVGKTSFEALVPESLYRASQTTKASKGTNARKHLLSGFLVCSKCLNTMKGKETAGKRTYVCQPHPATNACGKTSISMDWVDSAVLQEAFVTQQRTEPITDVATTTENIDAEIEALRIRVQDLMDAYSNGDLALPDMLSLKKVEEAKIAELGKVQAMTVVTSLGRLQPFEDYEQMNLSQRRTFISAYVANVVVLPANARGRHVTEASTLERLEVHFVDGTVKAIKLGVVVDSSPTNS